MKTTQIGEESSGILLGHSMEEKSSQTPIYKQRKYSSSELVFCLHPLLFCYSSNIFSQSSRKCQKTTPPCSGLKNNSFQEPNATVKAAECFSNLSHKAFNCGFAYILTWSNSYSAKKQTSSQKNTCNWHPYAKVIDFLAVQSALSGTWKTRDLLIRAPAFDFSPCWVQGKEGRKIPSPLMTRCEQSGRLPSC